MKFGCIIPAYNEADRIAAVLAPVVASKLFTRVIVVNDGSSDDTEQAAQMFPPVGVINTSRIGKSAAVARALPLIGCDMVCLLDADLDGLAPFDIGQLLAPVAQGRADVAISSRRSYGVLHLDLDVLSGERVVPTALLLDCGLERCKSMGMEVAINEALIARRMSIAVVPWPNVLNPTKASKRGFTAGMREDENQLDKLRPLNMYGYSKHLFDLHARRAGFLRS